jgi:hypothetical protein
MRTGSSSGDHRGERLVLLPSLFMEEHMGQPIFPDDRELELDAKLFELERLIEDKSVDPATVIIAIRMLIDLFKLLRERTK